MISTMFPTWQKILIIHLYNLDSLFGKYFLKMINQIYMSPGSTDEEFIY